MARTKILSIGGGSVFASGGTTVNVIPKATGTAGQLQDSALTDNATTVNSTEPILLPNGTAANPALGFTGQANLGIYQSSSTINFSQNSQNKFTITTGQAIQVASNGIYGFSNNSSNSTGSLQTGYSSSGAAVHVFGNGTFSDSSGTLNAATMQYRGLAQTYFVTSNFTTAANTNLQNITGLGFTFPANIAMNVAIEAHLLWSQATGTAAVDFGFQDVTVAPTSLNASGHAFTAASTVTEGTLQNSATTTATSIISITPSVITTIWQAHLYIFVEQPSNASTSAFNLMVKTATSGDAVTVYRGSYMKLQQ